MVDYGTAFSQLNIPQDVFDQFIADKGARGEIYECLMLCFTSVPQLKGIASVLLQHIAEYGKTNADGGPGYGNFGHSGRPGEFERSAPGNGNCPALGGNISNRVMTPSELSAAIGKITGKLTTKEKLFRPSMKT